MNFAHSHLLCKIFLSLNEHLSLQGSKFNSEDSELIDRMVTNKDSESEQNYIFLDCFIQHGILTY